MGMRGQRLVTGVVASWSPRASVSGPTAAGQHAQQDPTVMAREAPRLSISRSSRQRMTAVPDMTDELEMAAQRLKPHG